MALKDMKLSPEESRRAQTLLSDSEDSGPQYPYGLRLMLDKAALEKLGINGVPEIGANFNIQATAFVIFVSASEHQGEEPHRGVDLQITALECTAAEGETSAQRMYSASGMKA